MKDRIARTHYSDSSSVTQHPHQKGSKPKNQNSYTHRQTDKLLNPVPVQQVVPLPWRDGMRSKGRMLGAAINALLSSNEAPHLKRGGRGK